MIEEHLYWTMVYYRWKQPSGWAEFLPLLPIPAILKLLPGRIIQVGMVEQLMGQGMGRQTDRNVIEFAREDLISISNLLGDNHFFFGKSKPHLIDIVLYSSLGCQNLRFANPHNEMVFEGFPTLSLFKERMELLIHVNDRK